MPFFALLLDEYQPTGLVRLAIRRLGVPLQQPRVGRNMPRRNASGVGARRATNRAFRDWGKIFDVDNTLATAMIDRLMHHGEALVIRGDSYRMKDKDQDEE